MITGSALRDQSLRADGLDAPPDALAAIDLDLALDSPAILLMAALLHLFMGHQAQMPGID